MEREGINIKTLKALDDLMAKGVSSIEELMDVGKSLIAKYGKPVAILTILVVLFNKYAKSFLMYLVVTYLLLHIYTFIAGLKNITIIPWQIFFAGCYIIYLIGKGE